MICYRRLCETRRIGRELNRIWTRLVGLTSEFRGVVEDLDAYASRGF